MNIYTDEEFSRLMQTLSKQENESCQDEKDLRHKKEQVQLATILKRTVLELKKARAKVVDMAREHSLQLQQAQKEMERLQTSGKVEAHPDVLKKALIDLKSSRQQAKELQSEVDKAQDRYAMLQQRVSALESEKQKHILHAEDLETLRKRQAQMADSLKKVLDQLKEKSGEIEQLETQRNESSQNERHLLEENAHLRVHLEEARQEIQRLKMQESMAKNDLTSHELKQSELGKEVGTLKELLEQAEAHFREKQRLFEMGQAEQVALGIENQTLKIRINALEREYSEWDARVKELETTLADKEKYALWFQAEKAQVAARECQIETLNRAFSEERSLKEAAYQELQQQRLDFDNELSLWHERLTQEKRSQDGVLRQNKQKELELQEVIAFRVALESEVAALRKKLFDAEQSKEETKKRADAVKTEKEREMSQMHEKLAQVQRDKLTSDFEYQKRAIKYEEELSVLKDTVDEYRAKTELFTMQLQKTESALAYTNQLHHVVSEEMQIAAHLRQEEVSFLHHLILGKQSDADLALKEKDEWQESWERAKCELSMANEERLQTERLLRQVQDKMVQYEEEHNQFEMKERNWESARKELETLWKQHQEKTRLTLEAKEREMAQLKATFKTTLEKSQQIAHQTVSFKEREFTQEIAKFKMIIAQSAQIEENQDQLIAKLQDEMRTAWMQAQHLQEEVEERNRVITDKDGDIAETLQKMMEAQETANEQGRELVGLRDESAKARSKLTQLEADLGLEKQQSHKLQGLANERLQWCEEQMKQWQERYMVLQTRLQETQGHVATLEKAKSEYEAFMTHFKTFVNKTMPLSPPALTPPVVEESKGLEIAPPSHALPFGTTSPYMGKKTKSDLFDDSNNNRS